MADDITNPADQPLANGADTTPTAGLITQYVKDLSVENPNAPESYNWQAQPEIDVQVNIGSRPMSDEVHEVELKLVVTARTDDGVAFAVELAYCGLFGLRNLPEDTAHQFLFAEGPRLIFPFARRILSDAVRDAGYPAFMLDPIDFHVLYAQQRAAATEMAETQPAGEA